MRQQFGAQVPEKGAIEKILCALLLMSRSDAKSATIGIFDFFGDI